MYARPVQLHHRRAEPRGYTVARALGKFSCLGKPYRTELHQEVAANVPAIN